MVRELSLASDHPSINIIFRVRCLTVMRCCGVVRQLRAVHHTRQNNILKRARYDDREHKKRNGTIIKKKRLQNNFIVGETSFSKYLTPVIFTTLPASRIHHHEHVHQELGFIHYWPHIRPKKYFYDDHFPSLLSGRNCLLALLQDLHTILVVPKV